MLSCVTRAGLVKPKDPIDTYSCPNWFGEWVRAFFWHGRRSAGPRIKSFGKCPKLLIPASVFDTRQMRYGFWCCYIILNSWGIYLIDARPLEMVAIHINYAAAPSSFRVLCMFMKPQQCIAARELLGISPEILAGYAGVSVGMILGFEERQSETPRSIVESIQVALEYAGVEFLTPNESDRRLVCLRSHCTPISACSIQRASDININRSNNEIRD